MDRKDLRILYLTQKVDKDDNLLHPFYKWMNLIAGQIKEMTAVCLEEGRHEDLASNVIVKSLGKEKGEGRRGYLRNFYQAIWPLFKNKQVDLIFVHMTEINVLLVWPLAFLFKKPIVWWKAHGHLSWKSKLATKMVKAIATSSLAGFPLATPKRNVLSQGVDTDYFRLKNIYADKIKKIIWVGRISPIKDIETLIRAADVLVNQKGYDLIFEIIGSVPLKEQQGYFEELKKEVRSRKLENVVKFVGAVPHERIVSTYQAADVFINTGQTGSLDKTVLEAMACGTIVINSNTGYQEILKDCPFCQFAPHDDGQLVQYLEKVMAMPLEERKEWGLKLREIVVKNHNMVNLVGKLISLFEKVSR